MAEINSIPIPRTHVEAMASEYAAEWKAAEEKEITSLLKHDTWVPGAGDGPCNSLCDYMCRIVGALKRLQDTQVNEDEFLRIMKKTSLY